MTAYLVSHMKVSDAERYQEYTKVAAGPLQAAGGRVVARGPIETIEGDWRDGRIVIIEFPSMEAAQNFYGSASYQRSIEARHGTTEFFDAVLVPGAS